VPRRQQDTGEPGVRQDTGSGVVELVGDPGRPRAWTLLVDGTRSHMSTSMIRHALPLAALARRTAADPFPARLVHGGDLGRFAAGAKPITDAQARPSPAPPPGVFAVRRSR